MSACHRPCGNCPWRTDAPRSYWDPQHFADIALGCRDDGIDVMLCHKSPKLPERIVCAGWAAVMGFDAIGVRIASVRGMYDPEKLDVSGLELFGSFEEMLEANGVPVPPRNRWKDDR